jgi:hypothetical protein
MDDAPRRPYRETSNTRSAIARYPASDGWPSPSEQSSVSRQIAVVLASPGGLKIEAASAKNDRRIAATAAGASFAA